MIRICLKNTVRLGVMFLLLSYFIHGTLSAAPLSEGSSGSRMSLNPKKRWEGMSEERKSYLLKRYRYFKSLPEADRKRLKDRHEKLEGIRENLLTAEGDDSEGRPNVSKEELNGKVRNYFRRRERELKRRFPGAPERRRPDSIRYLREKLEDVNCRHMDRFMEKVVGEGHVTAMEAEKIKALPRSDRRRAIFEIGKKRFLHEMEGLLPGEVMEGLQTLDPLQFNMLLHLERERCGMVGPAGHMLDLTPEQKEALHALPEGPERDRLRDSYRNGNLKDWLKKLGEDTEAIEKIMSMPPRERQRKIMKKLHMLKSAGRTLHPEIRKLLEGTFLERFGRRARGPGRRHFRPKRPPERNGKRKNGEGHLF